jgi:hypothetical protein
VLASLTSFNLYIQDEETKGYRCAIEFELFAGGELVDEVEILMANAGLKPSTQGISTFCNCSASLILA